VISITDHLSLSVELWYQLQATSLQILACYWETTPLNWSELANMLRCVRQISVIYEKLLNFYHLLYILSIWFILTFLDKWMSFGFRNDWVESALKHFFFSHDYLSVTEWRSPLINIFLVCSSTVVVSGFIYRRWWHHYLVVLIRVSLEAGTTLACGISVTINQSAVGWPEAMSGLRQWTHRHTKLYHSAPCLLNPTAADHDIR
jgi:hypothetical protein